MTSLPASRMHLQDRGIVRPGMAADLWRSIPRDRARARDLRRPHPLQRRHPLRRGQRPAGGGRGEDHFRAAGEDSQGSWLQGRALGNQIRCGSGATRRCTTQPIYIRCCLCQLDCRLTAPRPTLMPAAAARNFSMRMLGPCPHSPAGHVSCENNMVSRFNPQFRGLVTEHFGAEGDGDVTTRSDRNRGAAIIRGYEDSFVAAADVHTHDGQRDSAGIAEREAARAAGKHGLIAEPQHTRLKRSAYRAVRRIRQNPRAPAPGPRWCRKRRRAQCLHCPPGGRHRQPLRRLVRLRCVDRDDNGF